MASALEVLFEDNHCLAVCKPAGLLTQGVPPGLPTLEALAKEYLKERYNKLGNVYLGIPHRLDRPVSGVVLFARSTKAARRLAVQFQQRQVVKMYWAFVEGHVHPDRGTCEDWLTKVPEQARSIPTSEVDPEARLARLSYRCVGVVEGGSLVEDRPETGRMHQIRVQFAARGWPIVGDQLYGSHQPFGPAVELERDRAIALHARSLTFLHPIRYEPIEVVAPWPASWLPLIKAQNRAGQDAGHTFP
jgi:23S rRNA pseudouridine1911/1915/1917 synthase